MTWLLPGVVHARLELRVRHAVPVPCSGPQDAGAGVPACHIGRGAMSFRIMLPLAKARDWALAAADGQYGCIVSAAGVA